MKNLLNIDDKVQINMPGNVADKVIARVTNIDQWPSGEILYIGKYHQACPNGGEGFENSVQFREGQYEKVKK